jgi:hypothetical protein
MQYVVKHASAAVAALLLDAGLGANEHHGVREMKEQKEKKNNG